MLRAKICSGAALSVMAVVLSACGGGTLDTTEPDRSVGGSISGLTGSVELLMEYRLTDTETLSRSATGSFSFSTKIKKGGAYTVTVKTQPNGQLCGVSNGTGTVGSSDVSSIRVSCQNAGWTVSLFAGAADGTAGQRDLLTRYPSPTAIFLEAPYHVYYEAVQGNLYVVETRSPQFVSNSGYFALSGPNAGASVVDGAFTGYWVAFYPISASGSNKYYGTVGANVMEYIGSTYSTYSLADLSSPRGMVRDSAGNFYISDEFDSVIKKIAPNRSMTVFAGKMGDPGLTNGTGAAAQFNGPWGLAIDGSDNLYVADKYNNVIRKITPAGVVSTLAGVGGASSGMGSTDGPAASAKFRQPQGVAVGAGGTVYVADTGNNLIRKITPAGEVMTVAGQAGVIGLDNGPALSAKFNGPASLTVDGSGNLYIADTGNNQIRKLVYGP